MFKQHTSPKRKADKQLEVGLFPLFLHCNCVITWTAVILLDLHATERRVGPAREGSELKMEERGVCRLSTIRALSNSGLLGLLGALLGLEPAQQTPCGCSVSQPWAGALAGHQAGLSCEFGENEPGPRSV